MLTEAQLQALGKAKQEKVAHGKIETEHPGYLGAQDAFYVGTIKGVVRIYQQTSIDTYSKVAFVKLYDRKNALVTADLLNDKVLPFFDNQGIPLLWILTNRGTEYKGNREHNEYELYLAIENIDHLITRAKSPQSNGICERFHKTVLNEFYQVVFRKRVYSSIGELQDDLDIWMKDYNESRTHTRKYCYSKTPLDTFNNSLHIAQEINNDFTLQTNGEKHEAVKLSAV